MFKYETSVQYTYWLCTYAANKPKEMPLIVSSKTKIYNIYKMKILIDSFYEPYRLATKV